VKTLIQVNEEKLSCQKKAERTGSC